MVSITTVTYSYFLLLFQDCAVVLFVLFCFLSLTVLYSVVEIPPHTQDN